MRVLVCGDRDWSNVAVIDSVLSGIRFEEAGEPTDEFIVIHGAARGADTLAEEWAFAYGLKVEDYPAQWDKHGKAAGPIRNQQMLTEGKPDLVVAFHNNIDVSKGTRDMVTRAKKAGLPVYLVGAWNGSVPGNETAPQTSAPSAETDTASVPSAETDAS